MILDASDCIVFKYPKYIICIFYDCRCLMIMNNATQKITSKQIYALFLNHDVFHHRLCFFNVFDF